MITEPLSFEALPGRDESIRIYRLTGPLVINTMFELQDALAKDHPALLIFDLSGVPYMDSAGLGVIVNCHVSACRRGGKVVVAGVSPRILDLFKITRVDNVLTMAPTVEAAEALA
ncbi:MAG TPA: STAS domain-containing protein [Acidobacteriaceae bacterium]|nr:STAS domain-containing protein [Acidobacteriaceae bacterium]